MKRITLGILAHVDSGKTTLAEAMLFRAGVLRKLGRVDHKDAFLDTADIEKERGITVFSKQAVLSSGEGEFYLLDTPGHVDFQSEAERTLDILDYAVLVVSAPDGVQSHTETLWKMLAQYNIPTFIFINKIDISHRGNEEILREIRERLSDRCVDFGKYDADSAEFGENIAGADDVLTDIFLKNEHITDTDIRSAIKDRRIFPCRFGSALKTIGTDEFLADIERYTSEISYGSEFAARVYKISEDERGNRLTHMKICGGSLMVKSVINEKGSDGTDISEKVNQIRIYSGVSYEAENEAFPGMVCTVTGLNSTYAGQGLGFLADAVNPLSAGIMTYCVKLPAGCDAHTMLKDLRILEEEDPQLHVRVAEHTGEIFIDVMGEIQLEVLQRIIAERFDVKVTFGQGRITYKETIASAVEGVGHYEPLRHYSEVHLLMEPLKRGSGLVIAADCAENMLARNWQRLVMTHLHERVYTGVLTDSPLTDMKITLVAGRASNKHTSGGDFRQATYRAVRQGLMSAKSILLEPWYEFRLEVPSSSLGRAMTDITNMGGKELKPSNRGEISVLKGLAPVAEMRGYTAEVIAYTKGTGKLSCRVAGYDVCHNSDEVISEIGYSAENDIDDPSSSVFCAHGAGFEVKWNKVREYMHVEGIESGYETEKKAAVQRNVGAYISSLAGDEELLRIFERTYGPIKRDRYNAVEMKHRSAAPAAEKYKKAENKYIDEKEYLLVDGYNIIFAWDNLRKIAAESLDASRDALINILCNYRGVKQCELILVFDAYRVKDNPGETEKIHNITVVYTKEAQTADMYIEKATHELGKKHKVRVATSDGAVQMISLGMGALRVPASDFYDEVAAAEEEIRNYLSRK